MQAAATAFQARQQDAARRSAERREEQRVRAEKKAAKRDAALERASRLAMATDTTKTTSAPGIENIFQGQTGMLVIAGLGAILLIGFLKR